MAKYSVPHFKVYPSKIHLKMKGETCFTAIGKDDMSKRCRKIVAKVMFRHEKLVKQPEDDCT